MIGLYPQERSFSSFKNTIRQWHGGNNYDAFLLNATHNLREYYTPFDYVNENAKLCIVGITPGSTQLENSIKEANNILRTSNNLSDEEILRKVKPVGAFSGSLRTYLVMILNRIGIKKVFGIKDSAELFNEGMPVHLTSAFNNSLFVRSKTKWANYNKSINDMTGEDRVLLENSLKKGLMKEIKALNKCIFLPIGAPCNEIFKELIKRNVLNENRVILDCIHATAAHSSRIQYFCGKDPNIECNMNGVNTYEKRLAYNNMGLKVRAQVFDKFLNL